MNTQEYIVVNKTTIENVIKVLEENLKFLQTKDTHGDVGKIAAFKSILTLSTPLIPEIEKAFEEGAKKYCDSPFNIVDFISKSKEKDNYISNLKLDI